MARLKPSLASLIGTMVIALHAIMLPLLYFGVDWTVRSSHEDMFVNHVRAYSKMLAEEIEGGTIAADDASLTTFLDSLALGGELSYAQFSSGTRTLHSPLLPLRPSATAPADDYRFGTRGDDTYFVSTQLLINDQPATLRLGFDEKPTREGIAQTRSGVILVLAIYMAAVMLAAWAFSTYLSRPLREMRELSRHIASGNFNQQMRTGSSIHEVHELAQDLETMRRELVGVTARLEQQLAEHSLLEARLRQKQRLETVGTLAGGVAHEFNNVLVPITLYAELALDSLTPDQTAHQDLKRVIAAVRRATSIVSKILTFSRHLEVGSLKPIDIAAAVDEGLRLFTALRPTDIEITTDIAADCRAALADTTLVVQIVMNLCTNAYHAMRPLGGKLHIGLHNVDVPAGSPAELAPGPYVCLSVVDTGHGMDQATRDRIFEPYFTTREVGKGTGLGLSVVHGIVASMGGSIHADSAPQRGTTMQVLIPAVAAATVDNKENA